MDQANIKTLSLACPSCGGKMELSADEERAVCPYCGYEMLIDKEEPAQKEYERRVARARTDEDIKDLQEKRQRKRRLKGWLIALCVVAAICLANVFIPVSLKSRSTKSTAKARQSCRFPSAAMRNMPIRPGSRSCPRPA